MTTFGWTADVLYTTVSGFGFCGRCFTLVLTLTLFFVVVAFPMLCCLRVDRFISISWTQVFTPLWILDALYYGSALFSLVFSTGELSSFRKKLLLLWAQALLAMKLDGVIHWSLAAALSPCFLYAFLDVLKTVAGGMQTHQRLVANGSIDAESSQTRGAEPERQLLVKAVVLRTGATLLFMAQASLVDMKVNGRLRGTRWWQVMAPVWIFVAYRFCCLVAKYRNAASTDELTDAVLAAGVSFMLAAPLFLLAERLDGKTMSSFVIVMPWMFLMAASFLFLFCAMSLAGSERLVRNGVQPTNRHAQSSNRYGSFATS
ncbi:unnamed protein product [Hyaloperonospora brassicae]|uniref:Transmembrane protein n=1 Tax=Hyaloperonospora brassicae TaxID=162125 RepID=A0AAV0UYB6_HYABA|nr:unnamed protein product [Hyaloperonospora brassicae]